MMIAIHNGRAIGSGNVRFVNGQLIANGVIYPSLNESNTQLLDVPPPEPWLPNSYTWDGVNFTLDQHVKELLISKAKEEKRQKINDEREAKFNDADATVDVDDVLFDADPGSVKQLTEVIALYSQVGVPANFQWRATDNTMQAADMALLLNMAGAIALRKQTIWTESWERKGLLDAIKVSAPDDLQTILSQIQSV